MLPKTSITNVLDRILSGSKVNLKILIHTFQTRVIKAAEFDFVWCNASMSHFMKSSLGHYKARRALFDIENNMKYLEEDLYIFKKV